VCSVCKSTTAPTGQKLTAGFRTILSRNGIAGDKAEMADLFREMSEPDFVQSVSRIAEILRAHMN
jgi:hypothetical protein